MAQKIATSLLALLLPVAAAAAPITIDNLTISQGLTSVGPGIPPSNPASNDAGVTGSTLNMIGGARNIQISRLGGDGQDSVRVSSNMFQLASFPDDVVTGQIIWDGGTDSAVNATGLGGIDLTDSGSNKLFRVMVRSDLAAPVTITVYTSATAFSTATFNLPALGFGAQPFTQVLVPFASFLQGGASAANFNSVGAITFFVDGSSVAGLDAQLQLIEAAADVPEPATYSAVGLALMAGSLLWRKKSK